MDEISKRKNKQEKKDGKDGKQTATEKGKRMKKILWERERQAK